MISQSQAIERARIAARRYGEKNPQPIQTRLMDCRDALKLLPERIGLGDEEPMNRLVWWVEMSGSFQSRRSRRKVSEILPLLPKTKVGILLDAMDGALLLESLWAEW